MRMNRNRDKILIDFLAVQHEQAMALAADSDILRLLPLSGPASDRYLADFRCRGLIQNDAGQIVEHNQFVVGIWFPGDYLRRSDMTCIVTYLGPAPRPWHPNVRAPYVCLTIRPGTPLIDILYGCYELFTWHLYDTADNGLNHEAAQWARHQDPSWFPIDRRPLRRRNLVLKAEPVKGESEQ